MSKATTHNGTTIDTHCAQCGIRVKRRYQPAQPIPKNVYCSGACHQEARRVPRVTLTCDRCGTTFTRNKNTHAQRGKTGTYCSRKCFVQRTERNCEFCGTTFYTQHSALKARPTRFCSRSCFYAGIETPWKDRNAYSKHKRDEDPEKFRTYVRNRRARLRAAEGEHTAAEFTAKLKAYKGRCHWCRKKIKGTPHADHVLAIAVGGTNDISNIVPSCAKCNTSKQAKMPWEFQEGRLL